MMTNISKSGRIRLAGWCLLWLSLVPRPGAAQQSIEATVTGGAGYPLAIRRFEGPSGPTAATMLQTDLLKSGFFRFQAGPGGAFEVSAMTGADQLEGRLLGPDGRELFTRTYKHGSLRRDVQQFADDIALTVTKKPGIATSQIAFVSNKTGRKELYLCDYDGQNVRQVTHDKALSVSPAINSDGSKLAYTGYQSGYADIYEIDLINGKRHRIINKPGTNSGAAYSPDGRKLALTMSFSGNPELYVTNASGGGEKRLTTSLAVESSPTWSPDGKRLAYTSDASGSPKLYIISAGGGAPRAVSTSYNYCTEPSWSPDGRRLAFVGRGGGNQIIVHDLAGGGSFAVASGEDPAWGANSKHLLYVSGGNLYMADVERRTSLPVVSGMGTISEPSWTR